jgi:hypothetical protein
LDLLPIISGTCILAIPRGRRRFRRNPGGFIVHFKNGISKKVIEISTSEVIWTGVTCKANSCLKACMKHDRI